MATKVSTPENETFKWPEEGLTHIPDWVYTSDEIFERERQRIFFGETWSFVALEAEIPDPGSFKRSYVGDVAVIVTRDENGHIHVFENRCAHRGVEFCRALRGKAENFTCPYHQWMYDLSGKLMAVPFRRGDRGEGGMPKDFKLDDHNPKKLNVAIRHGVVFASFSDTVPSLEDYLGPENTENFDVVFAGRKLKILGFYRNRLQGNWKLYHENLKDPYHATLLHVYLATFRLMVAGQKSAMIVDESGRHSVMASTKDDDIVIDEETASQMKSAFRDGMELNDPEFLDYVQEFDSPWTVTMQIIWPNLVVQRELNTLGIRHIVPRGPHAMDMYWTMFGYDDDTPAMDKHRLRQGNLMGPSGYLGVDDNEAIKFLQDGFKHSHSDTGIVMLEPEKEGSTETLISEASVRSLYRHYREVMDL
ncbi:MAG: Rieske 2Fe-2S domain-containing protein [Rhodospirillaceae bacterium]|jgi:anthranilate 1,2-dioxygenase large subunit|nr:Rieske 2Fe-2S domain-containing protein [Rhodospirillaceae bacterium]MBT5455263.1 Rieske 2Fe-2S domain-containing protein [Rhodospirillaceae bacterium]